MTGIERLYEVVRELGRFSFCYDLYETLGNVAEQIKRELTCDADTIENLRLELGEARDDVAWVREHGGLDAVKKLLDWVVGHCSTRQQLDFDFWLSGRVMHELGFEEDMADRDEVERRLLARLMPEGMEWMLWDDGKPVTYDDAPDDVIGVCLALDGSCYALMTDLPYKLIVVVEPSYGKTVVVRLAKYDDAGGEQYAPDQLTHERPDSDGWGRLEEDATLAPLDYVDKYDIELYDREAGEDEIAAPYAMARDLVRRARELAERERGE